MERRKRVLVLTGSRSEYDILYSVMSAIREHPALELGVIASGSHLSPLFGHTVRQIEADRFPIVERIENLLDGDSALSRARSAALQLLGLTQALERLDPAFLLVCGDREEAISAALAGAYGNVPVAHLAGGDVAVGHVDDSVRHAVSKLAHLHLALSAASGRRIELLGEEAWRIHVVGNPGLDRLRLEPRLGREELSRRLGVDVRRGPILLVIQHVISTEVEDAAAQMEITLEAVAQLGFTTLVGSPNSDAGSRAALGVIRRATERHAHVHPVGTLPRDVFVNLLRTADVLVGNSSLGILEAPFLRLPVVNVGRRQGGREHAENVVFVDHDAGAIREAVKRCLFDEGLREQIAACGNPFGDGRAGERIAELLVSAPPRERLLVKRWTY